MSLFNRANGSVAALAVIVGMAGVVLPACAKEGAPLYRSASVGGVERQSTLDIENNGVRAVRNAQLVKAMAEINAYQQVAGKLGQTMGDNFSVKRLGIEIQDDHDRIDPMLDAAIGETNVSSQQAVVLPTDLSKRLDALFRVPQTEFDKAFLASEIQTTREGLVAIGAYQANDLDSASREALAMLTQSLEDRLSQATALQRNLS